MIDFWMAAGLLLLVAMSFLLIPLLRGRGVTVEHDREALNVSLYQARVAELQEQCDRGLLDQGQLAAGRAEAARELLGDTDQAGQARATKLGKALPVLSALLVPLAGIALYLHYGASDKLALAREFATPPVSLEDMTRRLERAVDAQPDAAQGVYLLARTYMAQNRAADAARLFERSVVLAGRQPPLLGQWAQALYFAAGKRWSAQVQALVDEALKADPGEVTSLGLMGIAAFESQRYQQAVDYWTRLLTVLPPDDPSRAALQGGIAKAGGRLAGETDTATPPMAARSRLKVRVSLAESVQARVRPDDTVFVFARAVSGPPAPLAVKRLTVAQLPADIELSDADAMMPELKLSAFPEVQLQARVSRAGQPTTGEWVGRGQPLSSGENAPQVLVIDSPDS